jgi:hypothetical protein
MRSLVARTRRQRNRTDGSMAEERVALRRLRSQEATASRGFIRHICADPLEELSVYRRPAEGERAIA